MDLLNLELWIGSFERHEERKDVPEEPVVSIFLMPVARWMWMTTTPMASVSITYILLRRCSTLSQGSGLTLLDVVAADETLEVQGQALRGNVLCRSSVDGTRDETRDEGDVHHIREQSAHRNDRDGDPWKPHQGHQGSLHTTRICQ